MIIHQTKSRLVVPGSIFTFANSLSTSSPTLEIIRVLFASLLIFSCSISAQEDDEGSTPPSPLEEILKDPYKDFNKTVWTEWVRNDPSVVLDQIQIFRERQADQQKKFDEEQKRRDKDDEEQSVKINKVAREKCDQADALRWGSIIIGIVCLIGFLVAICIVFVRPRDINARPTYHAEGSGGPTTPRHSSGIIPGPVVDTRQNGRLHSMGSLDIDEPLLVHPLGSGYRSLHSLHPMHATSSKHKGKISGPSW